MTKSKLNIEWVKCPHGIEKRSIIGCPDCEKQKVEFYNSIIKERDNIPQKIPILRGCKAAENGGCFCNGSCQEIIGYREPLYPGEK